MNKLLTFLRAPYPVFYRRWKVVLSSSVIVFLVLLLLQPFGIARIESGKLWILIGYMAVTATFLCIPLYLLPSLFPRYYKEEKWTIGKYLINSLLVFLLIAIGNWLYSTFLFGGEWRFDLLIAFLFCTIVVGLFPTVLFALLNKNRLLAFYLKEAVEMNESLRKKQLLPVSEQENDPLLLFQGGSKEKLEIAAKYLLSVEAEGNYIKINYSKEDKVMQKLLRATIRQAEEVTEGFPFLIKCHRAFLVNVSQVTKVTGNSQGYRLSVKGLTDEIPVSRAYSKEVKMLIESRNGE